MPARVFVSYTTTARHKAQVRAFARLRGDGIVVVYDEDVTSVGRPDEGWPRWFERQIVESDYVLACCTAMFHSVSREITGEGQGARGRPPIRQYLYE
jgi:hypothetical protein